MADALDAVLHLVNQHNQQQQQQVENFNAGITLFNQARQAAQANQLARLQLANQQSEFGQTNQLERLRTANQAQQFGQTSQQEQQRIANQASQFGQTNILEQQRLAQQAQQFGQTNQLGQLQVRAGLAQSGLKMNPDGSFAYDPTVMNPTQQYMLALQGQSAAKIAGNPQAYQMYSGLLNRIMGGGSPNGAGTSPLLSSGGAGGQSQGISPNVGVSGSPNLNGMLTLGQSSTTDPFSGVTSTSQNQVNPAAQNLVEASKQKQSDVSQAQLEASQRQSALDSTLRQITPLVEAHKILVDHGVAGSGGLFGIGDSEGRFKGSNLPIVGNKMYSPEDQKIAADYKTSVDALDLGAIAPATASAGKEGSSKVVASLKPVSGGFLGNLDATLPQVQGSAEATIKDLAMKNIAAQRYVDDLKSRNIGLSTQTPEQIATGIKKNLGSISKDEQSQIDDMVKQATGNTKNNNDNSPFKVGELYNGHKILSVKFLGK